MRNKNKNSWILLVIQSALSEHKADKKAPTVKISSFWLASVPVTCRMVLWDTIRTYWLDSKKPIFL